MTTQKLLNSKCLDMAGLTMSMVDICLLLPAMYVATVQVS